MRQKASGKWFGIFHVLLKWKKAGKLEKQAECCLLYPLSGPRILTQWCPIYIRFSPLQRIQSFLHQATA